MNYLELLGGVMPIAFHFYFKKCNFLIAVTFACLSLILSGCATIVDSVINTTYLPPPYEPNEKAEDLHSELMVVDLHADTLLWNRSLLRRSSIGHVDLPRLRQGNVAIQVLAAVTSVPAASRQTVKDNYWDTIQTLAFFQGWPDETKANKAFLKRALFLRNKLDKQIKESNGALELITTKRELNDLIFKRNHADEKPIGIILAVEGVHVLEGKLSNINVLYKAGFRMLGLNHFVENEMSGGNAQKAYQYGLTDMGKQLVHAAMKKGMIIDLAHSSDETIYDVVKIAKQYDKPVLVSHTGVKRTCDTNRNLGPAQIRAIASTGGVIGVGLFKTATCGNTVDDTARAMRYVMSITDIKSVALGSDYDGFTSAAVDSSGLVMLTQALQKEYCKYEWDGEAILGERCTKRIRATENVYSHTSDEEYICLSDTDIKKIMGGNAIRVLKKVLK